MKPFLFYKIFFIACFILLNCLCHAQEIVWQKTIGGSGDDFLSNMIQTPDGGLIIGASSKSGISGDKTESNWDTTGATRDYWIIKLDSLGNIQWQKTIGGTGEDFLSDISLTSDGGYIVGGSSNSSLSGGKTESNCTAGNNYYDYWVVKLDSSGNIQWQNTIGSNFAEILCSVSQTFDGNYIIGGHSNSMIGCDKTNWNNARHTYNDYWNVKIDTSGNVLWDNTIGMNNWVDEVQYTLSQTSDGGFVGGGVIINHQFAANNADWYRLIKYNSAGGKQWEKQYGSNDKNDKLNYVKELPGQGYICGGSSKSDIISGQKNTACYGDFDYWIIFTNSAGGVLTSNTLGGDSTDDFSYLSSTNDLGFVCGGTSLSTMSGCKSENNNGGKDAWIVKLDSIGIIQWQNTVGGSGDDYLSRVFPANDGKSFICGVTSYSGISGDKTDSSKGGSDIWIFKLRDRDCFITGNMFFDMDSDAVKNVSELNAPYRRVDLVGSNIWAYTDNNGNYKIRVPDSGNFVVTPPNIPYYKSAPLSHAASFNGTPQTDSLNNFAFQPINNINDLRISITPFSLFRTNQNASYLLDFKNIGGTLLNANVIFYLNDTNYTYVSSSVTPALVASDSIVWNNITLSPFQGGSIIVTVYLNAGLPIGTQINSFCMINPVIGDTFPSDNYASWKVFTTGSFDPNEILVDKDTILTPELAIAPYLDYIINFQNTGNDTAFNVKVLNPIDTNRLDLNTFEYVASSHPLNINYIPWERNMEFKFENILLPDSNVNELGSHGFIRYRIKPKTTLIPIDSINNFANIYFDSNNPLMTNIAVTRILLPNIYIYQTATVCDSFVSPSGNYTWTTSGTYLDTIPAAANLDSVFTVYLTVNKTFSTTNAGVCQSYISPSGNYLWTTPGTYIDTLTNAAGCDSIITINLSIDNSSSIINQTACESFTSPSGNYIWIASGTYFDTIPNAIGCDSLITFNLSVFNHSHSIINPVACNSYISPSGNYNWTTSGTYLDTIANVAGCDSAITINLSVYYSSASAINIVECENYISPSGNYTWTTTGTYLDTIPNVLGCDSIITIELTINKSYSTINAIECESYLSPSGNYTWNTTGTYIDTIPNALGCDSIITVELTINKSYSTINPAVCESFISPSGNYTWNTTGIYLDTIANALGCDSIITIDLTINKSFSTINPSVCESYTSPSGNYTWNTTGTYLDTIVNTLGCDSIITIDLTINKSYSTINPAVCESFISPSGNYTWTTTGTYLDTLTNGSGCDSIITIELTINKSYSTVNPVVCDSYISPSSNYTWTTTGIYLDTIMNVAGCDSIITISLTVDTVDITVISNPPTLFANATGATYQWMYCDSAIISGEVSQAFTATTNNSYAVILTQNGCIDTSACYQILNTGIYENVYSNKLIVYPNPTKNTITISCPNFFSTNNRLTILDPFGRKLYESHEEKLNGNEFRKTIDVSKFAQGIYFIQLKVEQQMFKAMFVKN